MRTIFQLLATLACVAVGAMAMWLARGPVSSTPPSPGAPPTAVGRSVSIEGAPVLGSAEAPAVMVMFSDFECPFCAKFVSDMLPRIKAEFIDTHRLQFVVKHLPLQIHKGASRAAHAAVCADAQSRFWEMHDLLYSARGRFSDSDLSRYAAQIHMERQQFLECLGREPAGVVSRDANVARDLALSETPSFLLGLRDGANGLRVTNVVIGNRPFEDFERAIRQIADGRTASLRRPVSVAGGASHLRD